MYVYVFNFSSDSGMTSCAVLARVERWLEGEQINVLQVLTSKHWVYNIHTQLRVSRLYDIKYYIHIQRSF